MKKLILFLATTAACAEANTESSGLDAAYLDDTRLDAGLADTTATDANLPNDTGLVIDAPSDGNESRCVELEVSTGSVRINEIRARDEDWIELYNADDVIFDLSGYRVADQEDDGTPKIAEAITFPAGTVIEPTSFIVIRANMDVAPTDWQTDCLGADRCLFASWGISDSNGDAIYLLGPEGDDQVLDTLEYPRGVVGQDETWGRSMDGGHLACALSPTLAQSNSP